MSVSGTMRRRITPRAWACSAAPSRSRTSACAVRIGRGPRRSASARLSPSTQLAVRYANEPTTPAAYTWRIAGWSRAASVSVSRRNQARPGESDARCTCKATERFSTRSHAWYTARSGVAVTRWSRRNAGVRARTTSSSRSAGGDGWLIAPPNLTASAEPDLHRRPAVGARPGCVVAHIPERYVDPAVARIHGRRKEPRELRDRPALRGDERRAHRGVVGCRATAHPRPATLSGEAESPSQRKGRPTIVSAAQRASGPNRCAAAARICALATRLAPAFAAAYAASTTSPRSEEHTSELQSQSNLVCRLLLEKKKKPIPRRTRRPCASCCRSRIESSPASPPRRPPRSIRTAERSSVSDDLPHFPPSQSRDVVC